MPPSVPHQSTSSAPRRTSNKTSLPTSSDDAEPEKTTTTPPTTAGTAPTFKSEEPLSANTAFSSPYYSSSTMMPYNGYGGMMGGGMMTGYGMMGGYGMPPMMGPLSSLNQFLFGIQTVIMSLSQAVQILGMNTQALRQLLDSASSMLDHAIVAWTEMRTLEARARYDESEEAKKRRRRLRVMRWATALGVTYGVYKIIRRILHARRRRSRYLLEGEPQPSAGSPLPPYSGSPTRSYGYDTNNYGVGYGPYVSGYGSPHYNAGGAGYY